MTPSEPVPWREWHTRTIVRIATAQATTDYENLIQWVLLDLLERRAEALEQKNDARIAVVDSQLQQLLLLVVKYEEGRQQ